MIRDSVFDGVIPWRVLRAGSILICRRSCSLSLCPLSICIQFPLFFPSFCGLVYPLFQPCSVHLFNNNNNDVTIPPPFTLQSVVAALLLGLTCLAYASPAKLTDVYPVNDNLDDDNDDDEDDRRPYSFAWEASRHYHGAPDREHREERGEDGITRGVYRYKDRQQRVGKGRLWHHQWGILVLRPGTSRSEGGGDDGPTITGSI